MHRYSRLMTAPISLPILLCLLTVPVQARESLATSLCAAWIVERHDRQGKDLAEWMIGRLSSDHYIDVAHPDRPPYNVFGWMTDYCVAHPLDTMTDAAGAFEALHPRLSE